MENSLPKIVCHMMTALDGKITGPFMDTEIAEIVGKSMNGRIILIVPRPGCAGG